MFDIDIGICSIGIDYLCEFNRTNFSYFNGISSLIDFDYFITLLDNLAMVSFEIRIRSWL